jgi:hypothetical protein
MPPPFLAVSHFPIDLHVILAIVAEELDRLDESSGRLIDGEDDSSVEDEDDSSV